MMYEEWCWGIDYGISQHYKVKPIINYYKYLTSWWVYDSIGYNLKIKKYKYLNYNYFII